MKFPESIICFDFFFRYLGQVPMPTPLFTATASSTCTKPSSLSVITNNSSSEVHHILEHPGYKTGSFPEDDDKELHS